MALVHAGFFSEALGMCASCDVIIPQYSRSLIGMKTAQTDSRKVLWLLHGASDDQTIWQRRTSIERYAAPLGLAVVMPAAHLSSYADMAHGGKFFTCSAFPKRGRIIISPGFPWAERAVLRLVWHAPTGIAP